MTIERDEFGIPKFTGRDGAHRFRVEFTSEDGSSSGVEYIDALSEAAQIVNGFSAEEFRIETPFLYEERRKQEVGDEEWRITAAHELRALISESPPPAEPQKSEYLLQLECMTNEELDSDLSFRSRYQPWWIGLMEAELTIRRARIAQEGFLLEAGKS